MKSIACRVMILFLLSSVQLVASGCSEEEEEFVSSPTEKLYLTESWFKECLSSAADDNDSVTPYYNGRLRYGLDLIKDLRQNQMSFDAVPMVAWFDKDNLLSVRLLGLKPTSVQRIVLKFDDTQVSCELSEASKEAIRYQSKHRADVVCVFLLSRTITTVSDDEGVNVIVLEEELLDRVANSIERGECRVCVTEHECKVLRSKVGSGLGARQAIPAPSQAR